MAAGAQGSPAGGDAALPAISWKLVACVAYALSNLCQRVLMRGSVGALSAAQLLLITQALSVVVMAVARRSRLARVEPSPPAPAAAKAAASAPEPPAMARRPASQPSTPTPPAHKLLPEPQPQPQPQPQPLLALKVAHWGAAVTGKLALTWAMRVLSTADATTPAAAGPIVTVAAGWLLLGERLVPLSALSVALSLLGSTLMQRPRAPPAAAAADSAGSGSLHLWWWVPWMSTGCFALTTVLGRLLAKRGVPAGTITAELSRALLVVYAALAAYDWLLWVPLSLTNLRMWALLLAIALLAALADYSSIKSQALARVALLAPFGVVRPLATAALAYAAFGELPEGGVWWLIGLAPAVAGMVIAGELMRAPAQPDKSR